MARRLVSLFLCASAMACLAAVAGLEGALMDVEDSSNCRCWAAQGSCKAANKDYMSRKCAASCEWAARCERCEAQDSESTASSERSAEVADLKVQVALKERELAQVKKTFEAEQKQRQDLEAEVTKLREKQGHCSDELLTAARDTCMGAITANFQALLAPLKWERADWAESRRQFGEHATNATLTAKASVAAAGQELTSLAANWTSAAKLSSVAAWADFRKRAYDAASSARELSDHMRHEIGERSQNITSAAYSGSEELWDHLEKEVSRAKADLFHTQAAMVARIEAELRDATTRLSLFNASESAIHVSAIVIVVLLQAVALAFLFRTVSLCLCGCRGRSRSTAATRRAPQPAGSPRATTTKDASGAALVVERFEARIVETGQTKVDFKVVNEVSKEFLEFCDDFPQYYRFKEYKDWASLHDAIPTGEHSEALVPKNANKAEEQQHTNIPANGGNVIVQASSGEFNGRLHCLERELDDAIVRLQGTYQRFASAESSPAG